MSFIYQTCMTYVQHVARVTRNQTCITHFLQFVVQTSRHMAVIHVIYLLWCLYILTNIHESDIIHHLFCILLTYIWHTRYVSSISRCIAGIRVLCLSCQIRVCHFMFFPRYKTVLSGRKSVLNVICLDNQTYIWPF